MMILDVLEPHDALRTGNYCCIKHSTDTVASTGANGRSNFFEEYGVWKDAPILTGSTKFDPLPDVKNIMITGGAGFM